MSDFGKTTGRMGTATMRRGNGVLLSEPSVGLDTVYDGAHNMKSTAFMYGPKNQRWSTSQAYGIYVGGKPFQSSTCANVMPPCRNDEVLGLPNKSQSILVRYVYHWRRSEPA